MIIWMVRWKKIKACSSSSLYNVYGCEWLFFTRRFLKNSLVIHNITLWASFCLLSSLERVTSANSFSHSFSLPWKRYIKKHCCLCGEMLIGVVQTSSYGILTLLANEFELACSMALSFSFCLSHTMSVGEKEIVVTFQIVWAKNIDCCLFFNYW